MKNHNRIIDLESERLFENKKTTEKDSNEYFNSLIGVDNNFEIIYKYNKKKLVPFG